MTSARQLLIVRMNPQARGSLAAGMSIATIARTVWLPVEDFAETELLPGKFATIRVVDRSCVEPLKSHHEIVAMVAVAPAGVLSAGTALMAAGDLSASLLSADTQGSGTPATKGIWIELSADPRAVVAQSKAAETPALPIVESSRQSQDQARTIDDAICTACGCICDDIQLSVRSSVIEQATNACEIGREWFLHESARQQIAQRQEYKDCWVDSQPASLETAIERAADILLAARNPLVYGLSETTCEAQRAAVELADLLRANIDTTTSTFHGPTVMALQAVGESTCTLGEIRDRADLVMLWGVNPLETDPRHYSRYSLLPAGRFVPRGRADRFCVSVDVRHTPTAEYADLALRIKPAVLSTSWPSTRTFKTRPAFSNSQA